ncbi:MAG: WD40 repeat domain-containing protein, partial [Bryobacteraceae bacterium]
VSAGTDRAVEYWNVESGLKRAGSGARAVAVAFSPDSRKIASGDADGKTRLWDVPTGRLDRTLEGTGAVSALAFSPDGRWLAGGGGDKRVMLWNLANLARSWRLEGIKKEPQALAFNARGTRLAAATLDSSLTVWKLGRQPAPEKLDGLERGSTAVALDGDGGEVAAAGFGRFGVWEVARARPVRSVAAPGWLHAIAWHRGRWLVLSATPGALRLREANQELWSAAFTARSIALAPDGSHVVAGTDGGAVTVWNTNR